jgi:superfamily I DNA and/or RNA helicase
MKQLTSKAPGLKDSIGCISPYKKQVTMINEKMREKYGMKYRENITVNTVDAFQGQEKDVIVLSTVRANPNVGSGSEGHNYIGFLNDVRRLNVAITRPKFVLFVIGNSNTLATNDTWRNYIEFLIENNSYVCVPEVSFYTVTGS